MAARRDDSMLFSLHGLLDIEKQRVENERREHRLAAEAALARAEARERAKRDAELERQRQASEAARREAQRRKEEEIRLAALAQAALVSARTEAAARGQIELLQQQHEHERRMAELRGPGPRAGQVAVAGLAVAALCSAGSLGVYFGKLRPETQRVQQAYDELVSAERSRAEETRRILDRTEKRRAELAEELESARRRIATLEDERKAPPTVQNPATRRGSPPATTRERPSVRCVDDGDPMNNCLK